MKSKNIIKTIILSLACAFTLASCSLLEVIGGALQEVVNGSGNQYEFDSRLDSVPLVIEPGVAGHNTTLKQLKSKEGYTIVSSLGEQHILVIPIYFSDYSPSKILSESEEEARQNIYNAFFGDDSSSSSSYRTGWESVSSYYSKSSYGQMVIKGEVTDWYNTNKTLREAAMNSRDGDASYSLVRDAVAWFKKNNEDKISYYDQDGDGYLDGVVLIYANDYAISSKKTYNNYARTTNELNAINNLCWAFTTWDTQRPNVKSPVANIFLFASYSFMWDGNYTTSTSLFDFNPKKLVDSHTYIHEFGHMMGLDDYYSYDEKKSSPVGKLDMMDYNIGDHNAYSKYLLGWINPTLVDKEGAYTITNFSNNPSALLIPASLNDFCYSPFDEYIIIELYSPTGNNYLDSKEKYCGSMSSYPYMFTRTGVRMLHVDSRMIVSNNFTKKQYYTKTAEIDTTFSNISIGASNTASYSCNPNFKLVQLISKRGVKDNFESSSATYANNNDLFYTGEYLKGYSFNNGKTLDYSVVVTSFQNDSVTISIIKN